MMRLLFTLYLFSTCIWLSWAQPRLSFNKETHYFGQVEWKKPVTVEYTVTNSGNQLLVINNVSASCACAVTDFTKSPIAPGEKGTITAVYDAKMLGRFNKSVGVYTNAEPHLTYLKFVGEVVQKVTDFSNTDFEAVGDILIDKTEIEFPDVHKGECPKVTLNVVNQSGVAYEPMLMHLPGYLSMVSEPAVLLKGEKGTITLRLDSDKLPDYGLTQAAVYLSRFSGDKVGEENEISVSVVLLPDFSELTDYERHHAPAIKLSTHKIDLTEKLKKKRKVKASVVIENHGKSDLQINKLQVFNPAVGLDLKKAVLKPNQKTTLRITVNKDELKKRQRRVRVMVISNDPLNPKSEITLQLDQQKAK